MSWLKTTIGDVCLSVTQRDPSRSSNGTFRYVDIASIDRNLKTISRAETILCSEAPNRARKVLKANDVIVATVRPNLNAVAQIPTELEGEIASTGFAVLRANPKVVDPRYIFYRTQHQEFIDFLVGNAAGANYPAVTDEIVRSATLPLPPFSEQRRIVEILDEADRIRKLRREANQKAERILPALFLKMFGDPATNPKGWPTNRLDQLFDVVGGGTPSKSESTYWQGDIPWASPKDMKRDVIANTEDHITSEAIVNSSTKLVRKGSVLVVYRSGILSHTFPVAIAGSDLTINQDLKALSTNGELLNEYMYGWLIAASGLTLDCVKKGATVHNIDGSRFLALQIAKPPRPLQELFVTHLNDFLSQKVNRESVEDRIESLFSLLLHRAFSGQLTSKWRYVHMEDLISEIEEQSQLLNTTNFKPIEIL